MSVLCSDKTGTLTEGVVEIQSACDVQGRESQSVRFHAWLNASFEAGFANPIDEAIRRSGKFDLAGYVKVDEVPYDFLRKRLSILVAHEGAHLLITKGALDNVLAVCTKAVGGDGAAIDLAHVRADIERQRNELACQGNRLLGVAVRFIHFALFGSRFWSPHYYLIDATVCLLFGLLGFRLMRVRQMVGQYRWINRRSGFFAWRRNAPDGADAPESR